MLLFLISCLSEHYLTHKIVEERILYDTAYVEVIVEVEKEVEVKPKKQYNKKSLFTPAQEPVQAGGTKEDEIDQDS